MPEVGKKFRSHGQLIEITKVTETHVHLYREKTKSYMTLTLEEFQRWQSNPTIEKL